MTGCYARDVKRTRKQPARSSIQEGWELCRIFDKVSVWCIMWAKLQKWKSTWSYRDQSMRTHFFKDSLLPLKHRLSSNENIALIRRSFSTMPGVIRDWIKLLRSVMMQESPLSSIDTTLRSETPKSGKELTMTAKRSSNELKAGS